MAGAAEHEALPESPGGAGENQFLVEVFPQELDAINERIAALNEKFEGRDKPPVEWQPGKVTKVVGLALSGGGVRSAAFSLGALQALNQHGVIDNVDYLSTVSGGGYVGGAMVATMTKTGGEFVFGTGKRRDIPAAADIRDTAAVGQIRNYSNFLIPFGIRDVLTSVAIVLRGLTANLGFIIPVLLIAAAVTIWANPDVKNLKRPDIFGWDLGWIPFEHFGITLVAALLGLFLFFLWALFRSLLPQDERSEFRTSQRDVGTRQRIAGILPRIAVVYLLVTAVIFFAELQPFVLSELFAATPAPGAEAPGGGIFTAAVSTWVGRIAAATAPIAAIVMFFRKQVGAMASDTAERSGIRAFLAVAIARGAVWVAGAALPLILWVAYLHLSYWGITRDTPPPPPVAACEAQTISGEISFSTPAGSVAGELSGNLGLEGALPCGPKASVFEPPPAPLYPKLAHAPELIQSLAADLKPLHEQPVALAYAAIGIVFLTLAYLHRANANSLHRLYRDRLSKAFFFDPRYRAKAELDRSRARDFLPIDSMKLHEISTRDAPYLLINTTLNIQGSDIANRRGRNGEFFLFSPLFTGSVATCYARTEAMEKTAPDLDFPTAIAVSGAAASANMGSKSVRALTPTLALLNVRLGYWLENPRYLATGGSASAMRKVRVYLYNEITGRLFEDTDLVYLTDGGHIENLGIYELLRRKCELIVVVDGEEDHDMRFTSFITLQRYARIDFGVRIDLPWEAIGATTRDWMGVGSARKPKPPEGRKVSKGPHIAVGKIDYGAGLMGTLVYVKSSLTGDESDYIRDYARRYPTFPHESTGDQFFSEEQFEVYRALGFHAMYGFLAKDANVMVADSVLRAAEGQAKATPTKKASGTGAPPPPNPNLVSAAHPALAYVHTMLGNA